MSLEPTTTQQIRGLADDLKAMFTPPELITGCEVLSIDDIDEYGTGNGWIEARCGQHNNQRCRWRGGLNQIKVGEKVDVVYYSSYRLFVTQNRSAPLTPLIEGGRWLADNGVLLVVDSP